MNSRADKMTHDVGVKLIHGCINLLSSDYISKIDVNLLARTNLFGMFESSIATQIAELLCQSALSNSNLYLSTVPCQGTLQNFPFYPMARGMGHRWVPMFRLSFVLYTGPLRWKFPSTPLTMGFPRCCNHLGSAGAANLEF